MKQKTTRGKFTILNQICKLIPEHLVSKLAREHGVEDKARSFSPWSHTVSLIYAQITHAIGLNDVCDGLNHHRAKLQAIRGATAPSKNALSYANKHRNADMAEALFWEMKTYLEGIACKFGEGSASTKMMPRRFKRTINIVDTSTIELVANSIDWAKHRRRKAAAKCHLRLNLQEFLPKIVLVTSAKDSDSKRAREVCADIAAGEIVVFDKAYVDYQHLQDLDNRGVFWVTRAKDNMAYQVKQRLHKPEGKILSDEAILFTLQKAKLAYPQRLRRIEALVEVDGKERSMVFITNNFEWASSSICDLYKSRWAVELFFKQIKSTLQLCDFLGHSANAVRWQIWIALLVYMLLRFLVFQSKWTHSFSRLFTLIRGVIWDFFDLLSFLQSYGTAHGCFRFMACPHQAYLPGFT